MALPAGAPAFGPIYGRIPQTPGGGPYGPPPATHFPPSNHTVQIHFMPPPSSTPATSSHLFQPNSTAFVNLQAAGHLGSVYTGGELKELWAPVGTVLYAEWHQRTYCLTVTPQGACWQCIT